MSKHIDINSVPGVLSEIADGTQSYRAAATLLTERVVKFEQWLNKLPGKVPASVYEADDDEGEFYFVLSLQRDGKQWALRYWSEHASSDQIMGSANDLRDANIETKIRALALFPQLLGAIRDSQIQYVERSAAAAKEFDNFAAVVGIDAPPTEVKSSKEGK